MKHLASLRMLWTKTMLLTDCGPRPLCFSSKMCLQTLNALSDGTLDAGMLRIKPARFESSGRRSVFDFHY